MIVVILCVHEQLDQIIETEQEADVRTVVVLLLVLGYCVGKVNYLNFHVRLHLRYEIGCWLLVRLALLVRLHFGAFLIRHVQLLELVLRYPLYAVATGALLSVHGLLLVQLIDDLIADLIADLAVDPIADLITDLAAYRTADLTANLIANPTGQRLVGCIGEHLVLAQIRTGTAALRTFAGLMCGRQEGRCSEQLVHFRAVLIVADRVVVRLEVVRIGQTVRVAVHRGILFVGTKRIMSSLAFLVLVRFDCGGDHQLTRLAALHELLVRDLVRSFDRMIVVVGVHRRAVVLVQLIIAQVAALRRVIVHRLVRLIVCRRLLLLNGRIASLQAAVQQSIGGGRFLSHSLIFRRALVDEKATVQRRGRYSEGELMLFAEFALLARAALVRDQQRGGEEPEAGLLLDRGAQLAQLADHLVDNALPQT